MKKLGLFAAALLVSAQAQSAIVSVSGAGEIIPAISVQEDTPTNSLQQGFDEQQGVVLSNAINIDGGTIAAGTRVDSHLIFLNTRRGSANTNASWTFSGDILGVMSQSNGAQLLSSNSQLAAFNDYFTSGSSLPFTAAGLESNDGYSVAGAVLDLHMQVSEPGDWIRVVTVSEVPVPAALWLFAPALMGFLGLRKKTKAS